MIFTIILRAKVDQMIDVFNSINPRNQFTHEIANNSFYLLDLFITIETKINSSQIVIENLLFLEDF